MIINAAALNNNYGTLNTLGNGSPLSGVSRTSGVRATHLNVSVTPENTNDQFADLITQKTISVDLSAKAEEGTDPETRDSSELAGALSRAAGFIEERFGHDAATAFKGIVVSSSGDRITEDSLSNGLLKSVQFIDRNFGFAAGDEVMANFNSDLNKAINNHFENGLQEFFFAADPGITAKLTLQNTFASVSEQFGEEAVKNIKSLIKEVLEEEGNSLSSLKKGLDKGLNEAEKENPGINDLTAPLAAGEIMDNLQSTSYLPAPEPGSLLNIAV